MRFFRPLFVSVTILLSIVLGTSIAKADTYVGWHFGNNEICIKTNGWTRWPWATVASQWNRAGSSRVHLIADPTCSSYSLEQTIQTTAYRSTENTCGYTDSGLLYSGGRIYRMAIRLNIDSSMQSKCLSTSFKLTHVAMHETGHALGLGHLDYTGTIMYGGSGNYGWAYKYPTSFDIGNVQKLYDRY